ARALRGPDAGAVMSVPVVHPDPELVEELEREDRVERLPRAFRDAADLLEEVRRPLPRRLGEARLLQERRDQGVGLALRALADRVLPPRDVRGDLGIERLPVREAALVRRTRELHDRELRRRARETGGEEEGEG